MRHPQGVKIERVSSGSPASKAGVVAGDIIKSIGSQKVHDCIDFMFHSAGEGFELDVERDGKPLSVRIETAEGEDAGISVEPITDIKSCRNKCVFCFVAQQPKGLRKSLYIRDDDYRMSFLYGNYITLTNLTDKDKERILSQRLSPLYVSVHSTEDSLRRKMLGNPKAPDIMKELEFLRKNKIRFHAQIVLCPGLNDGGHLERTIRDLYKFHPSLASLAVVPVGLTSQRKNDLRPVGKEDALDALKTVRAFQKRFRKKHGQAIVFAADELYISAGEDFPPLSDYEDMPQIENGVGMVADFLSKARRLRVSKSMEGADKAVMKKKKFLTFTGASFHPYLKKFCERFIKAGVAVTPVMAGNSFFGPTVTVAGLLTGRDVLRALAGHSDGHDLLLIPDVVLATGTDRFLDDIRVKDIEKALGIKTRVVDSSPEGFMAGVLGKRHSAVV